MTRYLCHGMATAEATTCRRAAIRLLFRALLMPWRHREGMSGRVCSPPGLERQPECSGREMGSIELGEGSPRCVAAGSTAGRKERWTDSLLHLSGVERGAVVHR